MKILHLSTYDVFGGAALAAHRLHVGLRTAGVDSEMVVRRKYGLDESVVGPRGLGGWFASRLRRRREMWIARRAGWSRKERFTPGCSGRRVRDLVRDSGADIVHVHWIGDGFVDVSEFAGFDRPIVWTLHDSWAFTGGCHYPGNCLRFERSCGCCPLLESEKVDDLSQRMLERKRRAYAPCGISVVAPSEWLAGMARSSALFLDRDVRCIRYGLDLERYSPGRRRRARERYGIAAGQRLVVAGASGFRDDPRKGFDLFSEIAARLSTLGDHHFIFAIFGGATTEVLAIDGIEVRELGVIKEGNEIASVFAAADFFIAPSREDNLPNTVCESLACGTPVAGFSVGGIPEMIEDGVNGCLAAAFDTMGLASKINELLMDDEGIGRARTAARGTAERLFSMGGSVAAYRELYAEIAPSK